MSSLQPTIYSAAQNDNVNLMNLNTGEPFTCSQLFTQGNICLWLLAKDGLKQRWHISFKYYFAFQSLGFGGNCFFSLRIEKTRDTDLFLIIHPSIHMSKHLSIYLSTLPIYPFIYCSSHHIITYPLVHNLSTHVSTHSLTHTTCTYLFNIHHIHTSTHSPI